MNNDSVDNDSVTRTENPAAETHAFAADVAQLLRLMVHSVYSDRDVFLRELISNAADACEKLRHLAVTDESLAAGDTAFGIVLEPDGTAGTLTISDNGIGMSRQELADNLGTIARSGTRAFVEALEQKQDGSALIGQFGVGFYSAFMVAKEVVVTSRRAGAAEAWTWRSDGSGTFTVEPAGADAPARGTRVTVVLNDDARDYADALRLEDIVRTHAAHIPVPISLRKAGESEAQQIVDGTALWTRPKAAVQAEEYNAFYTALTGDSTEPALTIHYRAEGRQDYSVLAFVPARRPFDLFNPDRKGRIKLYVRRVFITEDAALTPGWLRFVRGIVDSEDLPLNISREMLQNNPLIEAIRKALTGRVLGELEKLAGSDADAYLKVWEAFGAVLKEGLYEEPDRRDALFGLARFRTTRDGAGWRSLAEILADKRENQTALYYVLADNEAAARSSPHLEGYRARGIEVMLLTDPVDAFWVQTALGYEGKPFRSVTQGSDDLAQIPLAEGVSEPEAGKAGDVAALSALIKQALGDKVSAVRASERLATSPVCLVAPEYGPDRQLEKLMSRSGEKAGGLAPVLELNPRHALIKALAAKAAAGGAADAVEAGAKLLFGQARILDGEVPDDPAAFVEALSDLIGKSLAS
ncbi:molecular chaperone HtpG [Pseudoxanthobacter sp.]|uniref:molecular chaperone HtpG n=1 Tax=Pseudoxanthobacter sp. TaxID=1925742 RepID=UPI002FE01240